LNSKSIRKRNTALIFHAIRHRPGISQAMLRSTTPIDRSTISAVVHQLEADGLLRRSRGKAGYGMGRPEDVLNIEPDAGLLLGFAELPSRRIRIVVAGLDGAMRATLDSNASRHSLELEIRSLLPELLQRAGAIGTTVRGAGLLLSGPQAARDEVLAASLIDSATVNNLEDRLGCPVKVATEIQGYTLAERYEGSASGLNNFIYVHTDELVRGALFLDGRLHQGLAGMTDRFGHVVVEPHGRMTDAGARGALNAYASRVAILERLSEFGRHYRNLDDAGAAASNNDALVKTVLAETGSYLGVALANAINLLDIGNVILGGDLARLSAHLMPAIHDMILRDVVGPLGREAIVRPSQLDTDPLSSGALALAMESFLPLS